MALWHLCYLKLLSMVLTEVLADRTEASRELERKDVCEGESARSATCCCGLISAAPAYRGQQHDGLETERSPSVRQTPPQNIQSNDKRRQKQGVVSSRL